MIANDHYRKAAQGLAGWRNINLRTRFLKIIKRAGLTPWPRLFHNFRSSLETDLVNAGHSIHVVCEWLGKTPEFARRHYLQTTDQDFERASQKALQNALHDSAKPGEIERNLRNAEGRKTAEKEPNDVTPRSIGPEKAEGKGLSKRVFASPATASTLEAKCFVANDLADSHLMSGVVTYSQELSH